MKFDVTIFPEDLNDTAAIARAVEDYGFDGLWTAEAAHNPFLPLTHAAHVTQQLQLGTSIAVAFPRSPMVTAQLAWDLATQSGGRFMLGLGTQIKIHIVKRFSARWTKPVSQLRDYVTALRGIWHSFQTQEPLTVTTENYSMDLLPPFFNPGPIEAPHIPVYVAGVGPALCRLAGEIAEGFHVHPFHTVEYLKQVILPSIDEGTERVGHKTLDDVQRSCAIFVVTGRNDEEIQRNTIEIKSQIAFYASTPSYRRVLDLHGWGDFGQRMNALTKEGQWDTMWQEVPDEIMHAIAVVAPPDELPHKVRERYEGLLTRVGFYFPFQPGDETRQVIWQAASEAF